MSTYPRQCTDFSSSSMRRILAAPLREMRRSGGDQEQKGRGGEDEDLHRRLLKH